MVFSFASRATLTFLAIQDIYRDDDDEIDNSKVALAISMNGGLAGFIEFFMNPIYGNWSDHLGRRPLMFGVLVMRLFATLLVIGGSDRLGVILIHTGLCSLVNPLFLVINAVIYDLVPKEEARNKVFAKQFVFFFLGGFGGLITWSLIHPKVGSRSSFTILFFVFGALFLYFLFFYSETNEEIWIRYTGKTYHALPKLTAGADSEVKGGDAEAVSPDLDGASHTNDKDEANESAVAVSPELGDDAEDDGRPVRLSTTFADELLDEAMEKTEKNPLKLICKLREESITLQWLIVIRCLDVFHQTAWTATVLLVIEELYDWEIADVIPLMVLSLVEQVGANLLMPQWERCFTYTQLWKYSTNMYLVTRTMRAFIWKGKSGIPFLILSGLVTFPFADIFTPLNLSAITFYTDPSRKGTTFGAIEALLQVVSILSQAAVPAIAAVFLDRKHTGVYWPNISGAMCAIAIIAMWFVARFKAIPLIAIMDEEKLQKSQQETADAESVELGAQSVQDKASEAKV